MISEALAISEGDSLGTLGVSAKIARLGMNDNGFVEKRYRIKSLFAD